MCGFVGFFVPSTQSSVDIPLILNQMISDLAHRGPDDEGLWLDLKAGIGLGHRRLAILDISPTGHQPMTTSDGHFAIAYNGEVYNFAELRQELEKKGHAFRGTSDTEVILASINEWGIIKAVKRFTGMYAFAIFDVEEHKLILVRDRLGIKPLYYGWASDGTFLFGSELKAMRNWPGFNNSLDIDALTLFLRHNYIPAPFSIYQGIYKLPPGSILSIDQKGVLNREVKLENYWSVSEVFAHGALDPWVGSTDEAIEALEELLTKSVRYRLVSDVPLGAFLSGGIDSSTVVALMQKVSTTPVHTFSIGFTNPEYNEAPHAKRVAAYLGTKHTEFYVTPEDALAVVPELPRIWDEPFADSSQIPTYLLSRLAREHVTVVLSGDGGDELFCGYPRYFLTRRLWKLRKKIPYPLRVCWLSILDLIPEEVLENSLRRTRGLFRWLGAQKHPGKLIPRLKELLRANRFEEFYGWANSHILPEKGFISGKDRLAPEFFNTYFPADDLWAIMSLLDLKTYLPEDLLTKTDRASMAIGLEARVPLLDHKVVSLAARFPSGLKVRNGKGKWILRQILYRHVPKELVDRKKMGFGIPISEWIRGPLQEWAEDLLNDASTKGKGYLKMETVHRLWREHKNGKYNHQYILWNILTFLAWQEHWQ